MMRRLVLTFDLDARMDNYTRSGKMQIRQMRPVRQALLEVGEAMQDWHLILVSHVHSQHRAICYVDNMFLRQIHWTKGACSCEDISIERAMSSAK